MKKHKWKDIYQVEHGSKLSECIRCKCLRKWEGGGNINGWKYCEVNDEGSGYESEWIFSRPECK